MRTTASCDVSDALPLMISLSPCAVGSPLGGAEEQAAATRANDAVAMKRAAWGRIGERAPGWAWPDRPWGSVDRGIVVGRRSAARVERLQRVVGPRHGRRHLR